MAERILIFDFIESPMTVTNGVLIIGKFEIPIEKLQSVKLKIVWYKFNTLEKKQFILETEDTRLIIVLHIPVFIGPKFSKTLSLYEEAILCVVSSGKYNSELHIEHYFSKYRHYYFLTLIALVILGYAALILLLVIDIGNVGPAGLAAGFAGGGIAISKSIIGMRQNKPPYSASRSEFKQAVREFVFNN